MQYISEWFATGERVQVHGHAPRRIFCKTTGRGPWLTFLHGFPTCSWDWARLAPALSAHNRLLFLDFLGFGDSDKPARHRYSIFEQADLVQAVWRHFGVSETGLVAHDYGDTVALELLARQTEGHLQTEIVGTVLLNGGVYVEHQRPLLIQKLLLQPVLGPVLSRVLTERLFKKRFASIFSPAHPISDSELHQHWLGIVRRNGKRNYHRVIRYLHERRRHKSRWEAALEDPAHAIRFLWGRVDPVSGANISAEIKRRIPSVDLTELADVGHYPQLEVPERVSQFILDTFR